MSKHFCPQSHLPEHLLSAIHYGTEQKTLFLLRGFVALPTMVLPNQYMDTCAKMPIHLVLWENRQADLDKPHGQSNMEWVTSCSLECAEEKNVVFYMNVLLWEKWEELYKDFAIHGAICPNIRNPTFKLLKSSVYFYSLFPPISFQFIATSCCLGCSSLLAVCF